MAVAEDVSTLDANGVFKGGGARGAAYAGALKAAADRGIRFGSVAGSSAGAITAALVAAGVAPDRLEELTVQALRRMRFERNVAVFAINPRSVLSSRRLRGWLDALLHDQVGDADRSRPVTFAELFERFGIHLYVVTMDLMTRQPVVFHHARTPDVAVADAVVASSAIPGALTPGRLYVPSDTDRFEIHQLVDGGAWANFPVFVYTDDAFRHWYSNGDDTILDRAEEQRVTIGFALDAVPAPPPTERVQLLRTWKASALDGGQARTSGKVTQFLLDRAIGVPGARLVLVLMAISLWFLAYKGLGISYFTTPAIFHWTPKVLLSVIAGGVATLVGLGLLVALLLLIVMALLGGVLTRTVLPSFGAALGPATGVAPWLFEREDVRVVSVPSAPLTTLGFRSAERAAPAAIQRAYTDVSKRLAELQLGRDPRAASFVEVTTDVPRRFAVARSIVSESAWPATVLFAIVIYWSSHLAFASARQQRGQFAWQAALLGVTVVGAAVGTVARARYVRSRAFARPSFSSAELRVARLQAVIAVLVVAVSALGIYRAWHNYDGTVERTVCAVQPDSGHPNHWLITARISCNDSQDEIIGHDDRRYAVGTTILIAPHVRNIVPNPDEIRDSLWLLVIAPALAAIFFAITVSSWRRRDILLRSLVGVVQPELSRSE